MLVRQGLQDDVHVVFALQAEFQYIELQHADDACDDLLHTGIVLLEDLDGALLGDLGDALDELIPLHGIYLPDPGKVLGGESRDAFIAEVLFGGADRVADGIDAGIEHAHDVARVGLGQDLAVAGHQLLGLGQALDPAGLDVAYFHAGVIFTGTDPHKGDSVPVGLVHVGLDLEDKSGKRSFDGIDLPLIRLPGGRGQGHLQEMPQEGLHAEIGQGRSEEDGGQHAGPYPVQVEFGTGAVQQLDLLPQLGIRIFAQFPQGGFLVLKRNELFLAFFGTLFGTGEEHDLALFPVINALEALAGSDGPVDGAGLNAQILLDVLQQVKAVPGVPVHLVDKGKNRDMAHGADLEQFLGLGLDALGAVDDHDGRIRRHQRTVGILREILVSGRIQNVDTAAVILELQDRTGHGNTSLLFDLHPVRDRVPGGRLALDTARQIDGASVQKEFFRQCRLAGVRMGDNGKCSPSGDFLGNS